MSPEELIRTIQCIKSNESEGTQFALPIRSHDGLQIGSLEAIDGFLSRQPPVVESLTDWRNKFMQFFLTQFTATIERTVTWLDRVALPANDRILFLIINELGELIGNFGVCNAKPSSAELDNLIRGRKGGHPKLIFYAEIALLSWLYWGLEIEEIYLNVFSNNERTIRLHSRVGFLTKRERSLTKISGAQEIKFLMDTGAGEPVEFRYLEMAMDRNQFIRAQPWARGIYNDLYAFSFQD